MSVNGTLGHLTAEQRHVVELPADTVASVTAGPGAGKTHTLVHRVAHLLREEQLASYEILVLTFSRAAVATLRARLRELGANVARVRARTFDSWAFELLREVGGEGTDFDGNFDARIRRAAELLEDESVQVLDDLRHVIVDEVQDLVGPRRRLVHALLSQFDCGFTVVGDAAQAIYDFQVAGGSETGTFTVELNQALATELVELQLTEDFRFHTSDARKALGHGDDLRSSRERFDRLRAMRDTLESLDGLGPLDHEYALNELTAFDGTTALLCRTNGEALVVSEVLWQAGVVHRLRRSATDRMAPGWLADLFHRTSGSALPQNLFASIAQDLGLAGADVAWSLLRRAGEDRGRVVDLSRLSGAIAGGRLPDELVAEEATQVVVSSFHRAKGLEFDRVVVVDPGPIHWKQLAESTESPTDEEARLLFVAMTRARSELWSADPVRSWKVRKVKEIDRYGRFGNQPWQRLGLECGGGDLLAEVPGWHRDRPDVERAQDAEVGRLRRGDPVEFRQADTVVPDGQPPEYVLVHDGRPVGAASPRLREHLRRFMRISHRKPTRSWPARVHGLRVDGTEALIEGVATAREAELNDFGVRRVPRLVGLSRFEYNKDGAGA